MDKVKKRVLAAASSGGHWEQLMLLRGAFEAHDLVFATTDIGVARRHGIEEAAILPDCNQNALFRSALCAIAAGWLIVKTRPDIVLSTGAAPGFFCLVWGRVLGARTMWIDSIANAEELSLCGKLSKRVAHECLTQWAHLATRNGVKFHGAVL